MNLIDIENNIKRLLQTFNQDTFIYDLLLAYNLPKATVTRLQKGTANISKVPGEVSLKKKILFKEVFNEDLHLSITQLMDSVKNDQRFLIVTDYRTLLAKDLKLNTTLDIKLVDLGKHYDFLLPLAGMEKAQVQNENPADIKAATKMAKLYDELRNDNPNNSEEFLRSLNVFLTRLLFCFFAEDSDIFRENQFTNAIASHTNQDGTDLNEYLDSLFEILNTPSHERELDVPKYLNDFPYVNGGLFSKSSFAPRFSRTTRKLIIESGSLDWAEINPDIFGSMFQAVNHADTRGSLGQHFTSVPNIMKVIEPLFLNDLYEEFEKANGNKVKLNKLLYRLKNIKIFDPACGSGNFLIIAYKELRRLEMNIFKELGSLALSEISLNQFYGVEIDDFAHEVAIIALWLTKHQMNVEFFREFGRTNPTLPLNEGGNIIHGNAAQVDWKTVCTGNDNNEIYILGNPPYLGSRNQNKGQKEDLKNVFESGYKSLDYIALWFKLAADYIRTENACCSFVSTNSITQGEQVAITWPGILKDDIDILFAYTSFKWENNAKRNAGVSVVIIGLGKKTTERKVIFTNGLRNSVAKINPYLIGTNSVYILSRSKPISNFSEMTFGNMPADGGELLFTTSEKDEFLKNEPNAEPYIKRLISAHEYINGKERWCLWLEDFDLTHINSFPFIKQRVDRLREIRAKSSRPQLAEIPHLFAQITQEKDKDFILIPRHSSERREYIPIGFLNNTDVAHDSCLIISDPEIHLFGILNSRMHMIWLRTVGGKLETRYRYSKNVVYNSFPFPDLSRQKKDELIQTSLKIIEIRSKYTEKTMGELYDPDKMPQELRIAHSENDSAIERCYKSTPFTSDEERLEHLFKLYEKMVEEEKSADTLFAKQTKSRKRR